VKVKKNTGCVEKVKGGFKVKHTNDKKPMTKAKAKKQLRAIEWSKHSK
jgi:hypothetical protein